MVLRIKGEQNEGEQIISLYREGSRVFILIDEKSVAWFNDNGNFLLFGNKRIGELKGKWKE